MDEFESLNHTKWDCKYHIVFIPKGRKKAVFGPIRRDLGEVLRRLAVQKECRVLEGHLMPNHVAHASFDSPEVRCVECCGLHKIAKKAA
jgi:REP-associated tyrosine transposase